MRLDNLTARPRAGGNQIDLGWTDPAPPTRVRIFRDTRSHPTRVGDGTEVTDLRPGPADRAGKPTWTAMDTGLRGETVYYYTLFTKSTDATDYRYEPHNRISAMATAGYDFGGRMFAMLPAIYHRYDATLTNGETEPEDRDKGVLRRFLEVAGGQFNQLYSFARATLDLHDLDRVDGTLLPLLAQWIGWRTDYAATVRTQRREIRYAPEIYRRIGTFAALDATSRRMTGQRFVAKEFIHNVACTNQPEQLNLWTVTRGDGAAAFGAAELLSVNYAYEGRPAQLPEGDGDLFLYHTRRRHGAGQPGCAGPASGSAGRTEAALHSWDIWAKRRAADGTWSPSGPLVSGPADDKNPAAAKFSNLSWVFWETYDDREPVATRRQRISFMTRPDTPAPAWSPVAVSGQPGAEFLGDGDAERRRPVVTADGAGGLWVFWQERAGDRWELKYNRHDGSRWQLAAPKTVPHDDDSRLESDPFVLIPSGPDQGLWLFGARPSAAGGWVIGYRTKRTLDPTTDDWAEPQTVPMPDGANDREPAAILNGDNRIELFFSSTRAADPASPPDGRWSIFRAALLNPAANGWSEAAPVASGTASQRAPLAVPTSGTTTLVYRSSEPITHTSAAGDVTVDNRGVGCMTYSGRRAATYGAFGDVATYTYTRPDGGRHGDGRIARDAIGLFLVDPEQPVAPGDVQTAIARLRSVADEFLPINTRAIFPADQ